MEVETSTAVAAPNGDGPTEGQTAVEHSPAEEQDSGQLFEFSRYVHVGPGANTCPDGEDGSCSNSLHVHMWIRLPNTFQHASIREKALAAQARRTRLLRDPESDARQIIDAAIEDAVVAGDRDALVDEIVGKDLFTDHMKAIRAIQEQEDFKHIEEDQERLRVLGEKPEDERGEEYAELESHDAKFKELVLAERDKLQLPVRDSLADKSLDELADLVRQNRIAADGRAAFNESYAKWQWLVGTLKPRDPSKGLPYIRHFENIESLQAMPPEVYEALDKGFTEIESAQGRRLNP